MSLVKIAPLTMTLLDFIKSDAGIAEAQFDARVFALNSAYFHILKSGNKTQWNLVTEQLALYKTAKDCGALVGSPNRMTPKAKRAFEVFGAYNEAIKTIGIPAVMKDATPEEMKLKALELAEQFATMVTVTLTPEVKAVKTDEEKAAIKAEKEEIKRAASEAAEAEYNATVQTEAAKLAATLATDSAVPAMADMVRMVAAAARSGALDTEALALLDAALDSKAVVTFEMPEEETAIA